MQKIPTVKNGIKSINEYLDKPGSESFIRELLGAKAPDRSEIEISFFQLCNLRCSFCWQDHDDAAGIDTIPSKADVVNKYISECDHLKDRIEIVMTGGELFQDGVDYFQDYYEFISRVHLTWASLDPSKTISFMMISNLSFNYDTAQKLQSFMRRLDSISVKYQLATSWDPSGRPIGQAFRDNLDLFADRIAGITMVLTKPSIDSLLAGNSYFDLLYSRFEMDFDYYVPTAVSKGLMPSDVDLVKIFKLFVDKYSHIPRIRSWIKQPINVISCGSLNKITILPDGSLVACRQVNYKPSDFNTEIAPNSNANIIQSYIKNNECLSCPYFARCTMSCFVMNDHKDWLGKRQMDHCLYKDVFKYIDEK